MDMGKKKNPGLFLAFTSTLAYTLGDIGVRLVIGDLTPLGLVFLRGLLSLATAIIAARILKRQLWGRHWLLLSISGLFFFMATCSVFTAISLIPLYQVFVLLFMYPLLAIFLAWPINNEKIVGRDVFKACLALGGCILLLWPDKAAGLSFSFGHILALFGSLCHSVSSVMVRRLGEANSGFEPLFHYGLYCVLGTVPLAWLLGMDLGLLRGGLEGTAYGFVTVSLTSLGLLLNFAALKWLPAHQVGIIGTLEMAGVALASWLLFQDPITARAILGGALVLAVSLSIRSRD